MAIDVTPTKSNLLDTKASLELAKKGYELLDQKRNVLIREVMSLIDKAKELEEKINVLFPEAYKALQVANMTEGIDTVENIALSINEEKDFNILLRSVMGVEVQTVKYDKNDLKASYSFYSTNNAFDMAVKKFQEVKYLIFEYAAVENSVHKLALEIKKTQKRTNALQNIQIPKFVEMVKTIQGALDEREREEFFRLKMLKKKKMHTGK